jgi:hypothetical protein
VTLCSLLGGCTYGTYDDRPADQEAPPHWYRLSQPQHLRRTRVTTFAVVPDVSKQQPWEADAHSSLGVRPADVAVYVLDGTASDLDLARMLEHMQAQSSETLHAVLVYGPLPRCDFGRLPRAWLCLEVRQRRLARWQGRPLSSLPCLSARAWWVRLPVPPLPPLSSCPTARMSTRKWRRRWGRHGPSVGLYGLRPKTPPET